MGKKNFANESYYKSLTSDGNPEIFKFIFSKK